MPAEVEGAFQVKLILSPANEAEAPTGAGRGMLPSPSIGIVVISIKNAMLITASITRPFIALPYQENDVKWQYNKVKKIGAIGPLHSGPVHTYLSLSQHCLDVVV
jgi:hypothetical protein